MKDAKNTRWVPELLAPAGSLEKLKVAISYGADAVYLGGQKYGLRQAADNFTIEEIREGVEFAHAHGSCVYVVLNSFFHDKDFDGLLDFIQELDAVKIDAVIVSDPGVINYIAENTNLEIHLSTQASCLNVESAKLWKKLGVTRIVLGREVSIADAKMIKEEAGVEIEMFVHGSMCMAYSGNCVISNYTQGRDSNRGGCAHSCRFEYKIDDGKKELNSYFMSSKDLEGIRLLQDFIDAGIDSLKVEGRMKSPMYAGTISMVYSQALAYYKEHGNFLSEDLLKWEEELTKVTHRAYTQASLVEEADESSIYNDREHEEKTYRAIGKVAQVVKDEFIVVDVKSAFEIGESLEILPFNDSHVEVNISHIKNLAGQDFSRTRPGALFKIPYVDGVDINNLVRARVTN
ncbi:U32 family peptidase [Halobacteriovorax vibrionivorans]|uniref:U32 family peptidase n=1 Tax=Halobacteriovorax vibrionivorans TaxID=2152716 RepID=A0ABY0IC34_9BACT|nr:MULTISPECIES: U32 family peptidase C-terminal domain-containing protein [Halobacteriovorax]RZF20522.1 U32 family peptidase [Halobacteriovorax vibrionivorans]TGD47435.1 U32 family peptidase [Halobacteriovorax sp. Y22]